MPICPLFEGAGTRVRLFTASEPHCLAFGRSAKPRHRRLDNLASGRHVRQDAAAAGPPRDEDGPNSAPDTNSRGTATSAIWNVTYPECVTTLAPILISFSRSVVNDQCFTDLGRRRPGSPATRRSAVRWLDTPETLRTAVRDLFGTGRDPRGREAQARVYACIKFYRLLGRVPAAGRAWMRRLYD